jgi:hypothetical protein
MMVLFSDMELFGGDQATLFDLGGGPAVGSPARAAIGYGDEPGVIDLFGVGQLAIVGI